MMKVVQAIPYIAAGMLALSLVAPAAQAQKIVCWKDASGKTVGCGDKVPAEYAGGSTKELDKQGNVRKTSESADEIAKRKAAEKDQAQAKAEETKRLTEQKRQDSALINTFSNEKEIDLKRDRELLALDNFIIQQRAALKVANERVADAKSRAANYEKDKKPLSPAVKEDMARAEREQTRVSGEIAANEKAKADTSTKYAEYRRRYSELKGTAPAPEAKAPATAAATTAATTPAAAPAKK